MGWAVLAHADRVVSPDVNQAQLLHGGQSDRAAHVVAEGQESCAVRKEAAVQGNAVGDAAHSVFADAETDVAP